MNNVRPVVPISVVIPCYRCASTIFRAVESVLAQSVTPAEIILVEDFSDDDTLTVLKELNRVHLERIKIVQMEKNCGAGSARNAGWATATQQYIAFLDADDSWHPEKLRIQYEYMHNSPDVVLCGHQCVWLRDRDTPPALPENISVTKIKPANLLFKNAFSTPTVMLKRDIQLRFQEGKRYAEDFLLWQLIVLCGLKAARIEIPLAYVHKPLYGADGLSAHTWKMEQGELSNINYLYRAGNIGNTLYVASLSFSIAKFVRRLLMIKFMFFQKGRPIKSIK